MLTLTEYGHLWKTHFSGIVPAGVIMPDYSEYLNREIYQQDYLDLFGAIVAETFPRVMIGANWYVEITRHPILSTLGLTLLHRPYIYHHTDGNDYLLVDYDFPYKGQLNKGRCIKYIMIGEAARPDTAGTYFYNINHTNRTDYFSAPCNAFSVVKGSKRDKLIDLAINGVVLLDIFPFAYSYSPTIRKSLNDNNVTFDFWGNLNNPYSVATRLGHLAVAANCRGALIAPPIISHHIAVGLNGGNALPPVVPPYINLGIVFRMSMNTFNPTHSDNNNHFFNKIPNVTTLIPWHPIIPAYFLVGITSVPIYCCSAYCGSGQGPHELFIRNAFGIV
jgi:hypothetical protein